MRKRMYIAVFLLASCAPALAVTETLRVPLHGGKLRPGDLSAGLLERLNVSSSALGEIDLTGLRGSLFVSAWNASLGDGCRITIDDDALKLRIDTEKLPRSVDQSKRAARTFTEVVTPQATADQRRFYGLLLPQVVDETRPLVVLVHGLDCNRSNWAPMADFLIGEGWQIAYFTFPSDQPLVESAQLLRQQIAAVRDVFPNMLLNVLTHSMGALVAREFIEAPDYTGGIERLIMIAPPNHGTKWAALRMALELEEHYYLWKQEPTWRPSWAITDGLGEAGRDLKAKSAFLKALNDRPRRENVRYTIIAGNQHPASRLAADAARGAARIIPPNARGWWGFRQTYRSLRHAEEEFRDDTARSDGPVSIKSARLEGVDDFVVLNADHTTLYIPENRNAVPPAWAVVKDRLGH